MARLGFLILRIDGIELSSGSIADLESVYEFDEPDSEFEDDVWNPTFFFF